MPIDVYDFLRHYGTRAQQGPSAEEWPEFKRQIREVERRAAAVRMQFSMAFESDDTEASPPQG